MKKIISIAIFAFSVQITFAQNPNPFKSIGKPAPEFLSLSNGKYPEIFENDTLRKIGSVMFNTRTNKIEYFIETDTMYSEATLQPEIVSRWLSQDPLARKYPSLSPYNFVGNNPIMFIDPDGREIWIYSSNESQEPILYQPNMEVIGDKQQQQTIAALNYISNSGSDTYGIINTLANDKTNIRITEGVWSDHLSSSNYKLNSETPVAGNIPWSPEGGVVTNEGGRQSAANGLLHELGHFYFIEYDPLGVYAEQPDPNDFKDPADFTKAYDAWDKKWTDYAKEKGYDNIEDYWIIEGPENDYSNKNGEATRKAHSYDEEFKAKDFKSLEGPTKSEQEK